ncbi:MAG: hypothetical protein ACI87N_000830 [Flavobacteriales bacterium]|jgi:hypothetical protein
MKIIKTFLPLAVKSQQINAFLGIKDGKEKNIT